MKPTKIIKKEDITHEVADRYWAKVEKGPDCWNWTGAKSSGYGDFYIGGRGLLAHRVAWTMENGEIPTGLLVLHRCDNPSCVNPEHLFAGTYQDNADDMVSKGRQAKGDQAGSRKYPERRPKGDGHWSRKHPELRPFGDKNGSRLRPERLARGDSHWSRLHPELVVRGKGHGMSKLTEDDVRKIRDLHGAGLSHRAIAKGFNVTRHSVGNVLSGKTWKHVL
jgi:hypothetical protein